MASQSLSGIEAAMRGTASTDLPLQLGKAGSISGISVMSEMICTDAARVRNWSALEQIALDGQYDSAGELTSSGWIGR